MNGIYILFLQIYLEDCAKKVGFDEETTKEFAVQTVYELNKCFIVTDESPNILKERAKSPQMVQLK